MPLCGALDVDRVLSFRRVFNVEGDFVAFLKLFKGHANQGFAVEEQVFFLTLYGDKAKTSVGFFLDNTIHKCIDVNG